MRAPRDDEDTNDALVDSVIWEFKRIDSGMRRTLKRRETDKLKRQGPRFIVDLSQRPMSTLDAENCVAELLEDDRISEILLVQKGKARLQKGKARLFKK